TPLFSTTRATTSSSLSSGSATRADLIARIISHTSGPPARAARRPVGPSRNTTPGCSAVRSPSSTSRLAAADNERPGWDAANELRRRATSGSNLTGVGDLRAINYSVIDGACSVYSERALVVAIAGGATGLNRWPIPRGAPPRAPRAGGGGGDP